MINNPELMAELKQIAKESGKILDSVSDEYLDIRIKEIFSDFLDMHKLLDNSSTVKVLKDKLSKTRKKSEQLKQTLKQLGPAETAWLGIIKVEDEDSDPFKWLATDDNQKEVTDLINYLDNIKDRVNRALDSLPDSKPGPVEDVALKFFIKQMASLWEQITGKRPRISYSDYTGEYESEFLDLVYKCLKCLEHTHQSKSALGKAIQRALA